MKKVKIFLSGYQASTQRSLTLEVRIQDKKTNGSPEISELNESEILLIETFYLGFPCNKILQVKWLTVCCIGKIALFKIINSKHTKRFSRKWNVP
jgi:hypothetical protein